MCIRDSPCVIRPALLYASCLCGGAAFIRAAGFTAGRDTTGLSCSGADAFPCPAAGLSGVSRRTAGRSAAGAGGWPVRAGAAARSCAFPVSRRTAPLAFPSTGITAGRSCGPVSGWRAACPAAVAFCWLSSAAGRACLGGAGGWACTPGACPVWETSGTMAGLSCVCGAVCRFAGSDCAGTSVPPYACLLYTSRCV